MLCSSKIGNAQVWNGSSVSTQTNDHVQIGPATVNDAKLKIYSTWGISNCTYNSVPALNIEWGSNSGPIPSPMQCPNGTTGDNPDIVTISNTGNNGMSNYNYPILKIKEQSFSLWGLKEDNFQNTIHNYTGFTGNTQFKSKVRIGNGVYNSNTHWNTANFPYSFSVDNGNSRFLGKVQIGNLKPTNSFANYSLGVDGDIVCKKMIVQITDWADFVFQKSYKLQPLAEVEQYIIANKHLPAMPSEKDIVSNGLDTGEMLKMQQQKIEELTLYLIQQQKQIDELSSQLKK